jgi:hypothetical protein
MSQRRVFRVRFYYHNICYGLCNVIKWLNEGRAK